jgi:hypothetical protein
MVMMGTPGPGIRTVPIPPGRYRHTANCLEEMMYPFNIGLQDLKRSIMCLERT